MDKFFENLTHKVPKLYEHSLSFGKKYFQIAIRRVKKVGEKSKIQIELEKLKWELKQKYHQLGNYIIQKKEAENIMDFSHDNEYINQTDEIMKLKNYIDKRKKSQELL